MAVTGSLARRYAKALLAIGVQQQIYDALGKELDRVADTFAKSPDATEWPSSARAYSSLSRVVRSNKTCSWKRSAPQSSSSRGNSTGLETCWSVAAPVGGTAPVGEAAPLTLESETLTVWPDNHRARSDSPVDLAQGRATASALGLRADNLFGTLELVGKVRVQLPAAHGSAS